MLIEQEGPAWTKIVWDEVRGGWTPAASFHVSGGKMFSCPYVFKTA